LTYFLVQFIGFLLVSRGHLVTEMNHIAIGLSLGPVAFDNFEDLSRVGMGHNRSARLLSVREHRYGGDH
jgi:hypothetical protein